MGVRLGDIFWVKCAVFSVEGFAALRFLGLRVGVIRV